MNIQKELFDLFQKRRNDYELYKDLKVFIDKVVLNTRGIESSYYYSVLTKLQDSLNNAGHEERRSKDIDFLRDSRGKIIDEFDEFLP